MATEPKITAADLAEDAALQGGNAPTEAGEMLRGFIERIERLEEEKKALAGDIREVKASAKAMGFDPKIITQLVKLRAKDPHVRMEEQALLDTYMHAIGMS